MSELFQTISSTASLIERNYLDDLSDQQLVDLVMDMDTECRRLKLESIMLVDFLKVNDSQAAVDAVEGVLKFLGKAGVAKPSPSTGMTSTQSMISMTSRRSTRIDSVASFSSLLEGRGPKINITQKTDMVVRAIEDMQLALEEFSQKAHKVKQKLHAELEEFSLRESDIKEAKEIFEYSVVTQGFDPLTQRISAEKFIRYMEEWLKSAQLSIQKLRLKTTSLIQVYKKVSAKLVQTKELGENVCPVDFAQLKVENKDFRSQIDIKSIYLIDLKKMNGGASLVLTTYRKYLQKQEQDYTALKDSIDEKTQMIIDTQKEYDTKKEEMDKAFDVYERIRRLKATYRVPDVIEYVKVKNKLYDLNKNIKVWLRRKKIQDITVNACVRQMKNITGRSKIDPAWLEDVVHEEVPYEDDDF